MKVVDICEVKGRGLCATVMGGPKKGVIPGIWMHQGENAWQIRHVENQPHPDYRYGLVLRPVMGSGQLQEGPVFL